MVNVHPGVNYNINGDDDDDDNGDGIFYDSIFAKNNY